ncbi:MAG: type II toxin-antitoxin system VapC family toxin [bacterium]
MNSQKVKDEVSISNKAKKAIKQADKKWISAISCWELAKLAEKKRTSFSIPLISWIRRSLNEFNIYVADLSPEVAGESSHLRGLHKDPADQIIVASSRVLGMPVVTSDQRILDFSDAETIW